MTELCIVIPTYDEANNIVGLLPALRSQVASLEVSTRVVVVDDGSPDGTGRLAEDLGRRLRAPGFVVEVLHRPGKAGLGAAYRAAMTGLLEGSGADWVLTMDADFSHDPAHLPAFVEAAGRAGLVVGSRYVPGGATPDWPRRRRALSVAGNLYAQAWLGSGVTDWTGGFNLYHRGLLERCDLQSLHSEGYGFQIEIKLRALAAGGRVAQVPIVFADRSRGVSKLPRRTVLSNLALVPRLRLGAPPRTATLGTAAAPAPVAALGPVTPAAAVGARARARWCWLSACLPRRRAGPLDCPGQLRRQTTRRSGTPIPVPTHLSATAVAARTRAGGRPGR